MVRGGIIPAHAGFTFGDQFTSVTAEGSSPHTRGLLGLCFGWLEWARIIPAHAGFTRAPSFAVTRLWDHPRTRGVYVYLHGRQGRSAGSSPHTRGLRGGGDDVLDLGGIIPAHAGFTVA